MLSEIGSIFWEADVNSGNYNHFEDDHDSQYFLSGRTALDYIIRDIAAKNVFKSVYMPSYCCRSMIVPFLKNNIKVVFYDVVIDEKNGYKYNIDDGIKCDAVLVIQYFGSICRGAEALAGIYKSYGKNVIEDATHSIFTDAPYNKFSDYVFTSFRKWSGLTAGAAAFKINGDFLIKKPEALNENYITIREKVLSMKKQYMVNNNIDKKEFLDMHNVNEESLYNDYSDYTISDGIMRSIRTLDIKKIKKQRLSNARYLLRSLKGHDDIRFVINDITENDCPFYVPIYIANGKRDQLKEFLSGKKIYCPSHWPLSEQHLISREARVMYDNSLSLVCDQRYKDEEMEVIASAVNDFSKQRTNKDIISIKKGYEN
jgi:dTDP-4-amino-4,6-dideoxygalactose transaminase